MIVKLVKYLSVIKTQGLLFIICLLFTTNSYAQNWLWGRQTAPLPFSWGVAGSHSVAADKQGNIYAVSFFAGTVGIGNDTLNSAHGCSYLVKYDQNGNKIWAQQPPGPSSNYEGIGLSSISTNGYGNIFVAGEFNDSITFGSTTLVTIHSSITDFIACYNSAGTPLWARKAISQDSAFPITDIAADAFGNAYLAGSFSDNITFGAYTLTGFSSIYSTINAYLTKYDANGNVLWAKQSLTPNPTAYSSFAEVSSVTTDGLGNIYLMGTYGDTVIFGADTLIAPSWSNTTSSENIFIVKYNSNGNVLWAKQPTLRNKSSHIYGNSITADVHGNAYVTGAFFDTVTFGTSVLTTNQSSNVFLAKYNPSGGVAWANEGIPVNTDSLWIGYSVMSDTLPAGGGYISMNGYGPPPIKLKYGVDTFMASPTSYYEEVVFQFDSAGNIYCGSIVNEGNNTDEGDIAQNEAICTDHSGKFVYVGGHIYDTIIYGPDTLTSPLSPFDLLPFVARWQPCCTLPVTVSPADTNICIGKTINVTFNASGASSYSWSPSTNLSSDTGRSVTATPNTNVKYTVTGKTSGGPGCVGFAEATISITPTPTVSIYPPTDNICNGGATVLTASGGSTYVWSNGSTNHTYTTSLLKADSTIKVIGYSPFGCPDTAKLNISVKTPSALNACCNTTITTGSDTVITVSGSNAAYYMWTPSTGLNTNIGSTVIASPTVTTTYTVSSVESGCSVDTTITITVVDAPVSCANYTVPNVFTPNYAGTSGVDNVFYIQITNVDYWSMAIYDRWGKEMFTTTNPKQYWTGLTESGDKATDGVYYYIVNATCQNKTYKRDGFVQLIR